MTFIWPEMLWMLAALPASAAAYLMLIRRQKKAALRYASLSIVKEALGNRRSWRRHLPPLLALITLAAMIVALARPAAVVTLSSEHKTVILAIDTSGSMRATDVEPSRMAAAQDAARAFVSDQPRGTRIGVVEFSGSASIVQPPTRNREDVLAAIERLQPQQATAVGSGILASLKAIFPEQDFEVPLAGSLRTADAPASPQRGADGKRAAAAIILLTDGQSTTGPDPVEAAKLAAERGVRVFTVGVGTTEGKITGSGGWSMRVGLDEESLQSVARMTGGEYFFAGTAFDLKEIYEGLNSRLTLERKETEIAAFFAAAAALTLLAAAFLSLTWYNRIL